MYHMNLRQFTRKLQWNRTMYISYSMAYTVYLLVFRQEHRRKRNVHGADWPTNKLDKNGSKFGIGQKEFDVFLKVYIQYISLNTVI